MDDEATEPSNNVTGPSAQSAENRQRIAVKRPLHGRARGWTVRTASMDASDSEGQQGLVPESGCIHTVTVCHRKMGQHMENSRYLGECASKQMAATRRRVPLRSDSQILGQDMEVKCACTGGSRAGAMPPTQPHTASQ